MTAKRLYNKLVLASQQPAPDILDRLVRINVGETRQLKLQSQTIRVVTGCAWLSYKGDDHVLKAGDELTFDTGRAVVFISSLGKQPMDYEVINVK